MLSLELAEKLKSAGLAWVPKLGDMCYRQYLKGFKPRLLTDGFENRYQSDTFAPSLSQLLDEIEGLGWDVERMQVKGGKTSILLHRTNGEHIDDDWSPYFEADITNDAVGEALLWILEGDKDA